MGIMSNKSRKWDNWNSGHGVSLGSDLRSQPELKRVGVCFYVDTSTWHGAGLLSQLVQVGPRIAAYCRGDLDIGWDIRSHGL